MTDLIVGGGEVGSAVRDLLNSPWREVVTYDRVFTSLPDTSDGVNVMHVCFPYSDTFIEDVQHYIKLWEPEHVIVWSTVPIGTCRRISQIVCHAPVEGVHPHLAQGIKSMARFVGYNVGSEGRYFSDYFRELGLNAVTISKTEATELLKLRSTARYGINLVFAQYETELCEKYGVAYSDLMSYDRAYNELYEELREDSFKRYVLYPPNGKIGGHCVVPNAKLLNKQARHPMLDMIIAMEGK